MASFRALIIGPPDPVENLVDGVCNHIREKDEIKNTVEYEGFSLDYARQILQLDEFHDSFPYLFKFSKPVLSDYLGELEEKGYTNITGVGVWFVCYNYSPGQVLEERRPRVVKYRIEDGSGGSVTPFSYDPAQDFKTEL